MFDKTVLDGMNLIANFMDQNQVNLDVQSEINCILSNNICAMYFPLQILF